MSGLGEMRGPVYETFSFGRNYIQFFISRLVLKRFLCRLYQRPSYGKVKEKNFFYFTLGFGNCIAVAPGESTFHYLYKCDKRTIQVSLK